MAMQLRMFILRHKLWLVADAHHRALRRRFTGRVRYPLTPRR